RSNVFQPLVECGVSLGHAARPESIHQQPMARAGRVIDPIQRQSLDLMSGCHSSLQSWQSRREDVTSKPGLAGAPAQALPCTHDAPSTDAEQSSEAVLVVGGEG